MPRPAATELEGIEIRALLDLCRAGPERVERTRIGSALAVVFPDVPAFFGHRIVGLGVEAPASGREVDAALDWMKARAPDFTVALTPEARPGHLHEALFARGFVPGRAWVKLYRDGAPPPLTPSRDYEVRRAEEGDADAAAALLGETFALGPRFASICRALVKRPGWHLVVASEGDTLLGTGALYVRGTTGWLGFGATDVAHRGRRVHRAIVAERIRIAHELGVESLVVETGVRQAGQPDASFRNLEWAGFREAYVRQNLLSPSLAGAGVSLSSAG